MTTTQTISRDRLKQQLIDCNQSASGMFEIGEDTICTLMALLTAMDSELVSMAGFDAASAIRACMEEFPESVHDIVEECAQIAENTISTRHAAPPEQIDDIASWSNGKYPPCNEPAPVAIVSEPSGYLYRTNTLTASTPWRYVEKLPDYVKGESFEIRPQFEAAPPAPVAVPDERAAFETIMEKRFKDSIDRRPVKNGDGEYFSWDMQVAWIVWQARAAMQAEPWIKCSERMPEPNKFVLVCNGSWVGQGMYDDSEHLDDDERWQDEHREFIDLLGSPVTHWMPLPAAPEQEV